MGSALQRLGKYTIERRLGRGGMGEVWLGRNADLDIPVAIKTLAPHLVDDDPAFVDRFVLEARTAARLNHPHIVRIFDAGSDGGVHYLVMEYVAGGSVRDLLASRGILPVSRALAIASQVARGLEAAARLGIIHRDIKPDNILLDEDGTPKLADLGLAKQLGGREGVSLTTTGVSVGTPGYISPEQAQDSKTVDARADLYSLGATLYHMLTGEPPYSGSSAFAVMMKHVQEPVPDPRTRNPTLSPPVVEILQRLLAKSPEQRPQTATEVASRLEELARSEAAAVPPPTAWSMSALAAPTVLATAAPRASDREGSRATAPTLTDSPVPSTAPPPQPGAPTLVATDLPVLAAAPHRAAVAAPAVLPITAAQPDLRAEPLPAPIAWRLVALAIDVAIITLVNGLAGKTFAGFWIAWVIYNGLLLPRYGHTLGKRVLGLDVVGPDGGRPSTRAAFVRGAAYLVSGVLTLGAGLAWATVDRHQRTLHDLVAGTRVVLRR